ncbi:flagellar hook-length control protein FliK [Methylobacterium pseudosasicola]|uniref:Flagellar hook-length control protein FliK n=1 Tax=Methylobacterium pseudosasicola TaxID=582667 RepID=A0A1I4FJV2_9HYPH|nr:flagellar hook-length control protein FliK [Methylobacterium pseudosasicola]SFL18208.1 Flagellar hook-length control protein FliK [Methylobacterium pseudosasicola]
MASGAADRLDVTGWIPSARTASTTRSGWDAAGVAARAGDSSQDRFGAALSAARARDDAAATRARDETQRSQADAARTAAERARDATDTAKARAAARAVARDSTKPPEPHGQAQSATSAGASMTRTDAQAPAKASDSASAAATRGTNPTAQPASDAAGAPAPNAASAADSAKTDTTAGDSAATETAQVEAVPSEVPPQTAPQATSPAVPGTLQALLAELVKGAPVLAGGAAAGGEGGDLGVTGSAGSATAQADTATAGVGSAGTKPGLAGAGTKMGAAPTTLRASGQGASPVEAVKAGAADPAAPEAVSGASAGQDFLAALADAGQGTGQGAAGGLQAPAPSLPHGNPDLSALAAPQAAGTTTAATQAAAPTPTPAQAPVNPAVPIGQVPMTIGLRSLAGSSEFQIRLDPAELGRIDVKLEIDKARGTVTTHLVVERPETLAMLQRDANQLQQALSQAGLDPSAGGLNLSLRSDGNAQGGAGGGQGEPPRGGQAAWAQDRAEAPQETAPTRWLRGYGGLDIRI